MNNIKKLRESRELTQAELARLADTTPDIISRIESGRRDPTAEQMKALAKVFRCNIVKLWK